MHAVLAGFGFLGAEIYRLLNAQGITVTIVRRSSDGGNAVACDLTIDSPSLTETPVDLAIFCLAPGSREMTLYEKTYVTAQKNFLRSMQARRYIYISSTAVYPDSAGVYAEKDAIAHSEKASILLEAESIATGRPRATVLRLAGLYSAERRIYHPHRVQHEADRLVHFIHRDDAARSVIHCLDHELAGIYNVHDGHPQRRSTILSRLGIESPPHELVAQRVISNEKLSTTGFNPIYKDYFSGIGLI